MAVETLEAHAANERHLIGDPGLQGHVLADVEAGHVGLDRLELAADLGRRLGLQVVHVELGGTAIQPDHDDALGRGRGRG